MIFNPIGYVIITPFEHNKLIVIGIIYGHFVVSRHLTQAP